MAYRDDTPRCGAKTRAGHSCKQPAGARTSHPGFGRCAWHGGSSPNGRVHGAREQAKAEAARLGMARETTPHEALEHAMALVTGEVDWIREQVRRLTDDKALEDGKPHPLLRVYGESVDRLARISKIAADAGVEARRLELDELVVERLAGAVRAALAEVELTADQQTQLRESLTRHLSSLDEITVGRPRLAA
jgi:hypothetical protein